MGAFKPKSVENCKFSTASDGSRCQAEFPHSLHDICNSEKARTVRGVSA